MGARKALRLGELQDCLPAFHQVSPYQKRISKGDSWKTLWLYGFGHHSEVAQQLCPATTKLLGEVEHFFCEIVAIHFGVGYDPVAVARFEILIELLDVFENI